ncbi:trypsin-like cysteine/serine peptidase domain-containing protein [Xylariaceae sp. FL0016]|nr:trypsin-like cysteine/serine peptidase domain-containing protein [Xylariaceae sp. FL0016]
MPLRQTRSQTRVNATQTQDESQRAPRDVAPSSLFNKTDDVASNSAIAPPKQSITVLPETLTRTITGLGTKNQQTLTRKQDWLREYTLDIPSSCAKHGAAIDATLVFAQEEAGTAVCISTRGILLTCAHCVAESPEEQSRSKSHWLLFRDGRAVKAKCIAWDPRRDLALLGIIAAQTSSELGNGCFPSARVAETQPAVGSRLVCVGHPGSEDLEASQPGIETNYDVLHASTGRFRGCVEGQDPQDNSQIGAMRHDCWTYWGHSGAPLIETKTGRLTGLHSSWDDETAMRHGIPLIAVQEFLEENKKAVDGW